MKKSKKLLVMALSSVMLLGATLTVAPTLQSDAASRPIFPCPSCGSYDTNRSQGKAYECYYCHSFAEYTYGCQHCGMAFDACESCKHIYEPW